MSISHVSSYFVFLGDTSLDTSVSPREGEEKRNDLLPDKSESRSKLDLQMEVSRLEWKKKKKKEGTSLLTYYVPGMALRQLYFYTPYDP